MRGPLARAARVLAVGGLALASVLTVSATGAGAAAHSATPLSGPHVFGWGVADPEAISSDGTHVWVANYNASSVTELDAATGALIKVLRGSRYAFSLPTGVDTGGSNVLVVNNGDASVTGFPAG